MVFADSQGELNVLDGYCRHMGGDLSQGTIKGDEVACPFHDWRWGGDGKCKLVPYAKRTPRLARTRAWTDRRAQRPAVRLARPRGQPAAARGARSPSIAGVRQRRVDRLALELDPRSRAPTAARSSTTSSTWRTSSTSTSACPTYFKNVFEGHIAIAVPAQRRPPGRERPGHLVRRGAPGLARRRYFGPSFMINWLHNNYGGFKAESILINCHYPVSQDSFVLQWGVIVEKPKGLDEETTDKLARDVHRRRQQGLPAGRRDLEAQDPHRQPAAGRGGRRRSTRCAAGIEQFYVDVADVTPEMTDRFEIEVDTTAANEKWHVEVEENLKAQAEEKEKAEHRRALADELAATRRTYQTSTGSPGRCWLLHGAHDDDDHDTRRQRRAERILVEGTGFRVRPGPGGRRARGDPARPRALSELGAGIRRLPVLPRVGQRQEAGPRAYVGAVELRSVAALRVFHRDPRVRR